MNSSCPGTTRKGRPCKNGPLCHVHCQPCGPECSICLNPTTKTRSTKTLRCRHTFHRLCIDEWLDKGGAVCPMCRNLIRPSRYKVTLHVENVESKTSNILELGETAILELFHGLGFGPSNTPDQLDIEMSIENDQALEYFLNDLHIRLSDVNSLIFDTERAAVN